MTTATARITYNKVLKVLDFLPPDCPEELAALSDEKILLPRNNTTINAIRTNM